MYMRHISDFDISSNNDFSLDPDDDPLCVLLFIDYFALQAAEYDFLIQLFNEWEVCSIRNKNSKLRLVKWFFYIIVH